MAPLPSKPDPGALKAEHLLTFCLVARQGSVSSAAERLGVSQPAVSRQLASLQRAIGQVLYQRTPHGIELTSAGDALLPYACAVAATLRQARRFVEGELPAGTVALRLGLSKHLVTRLTGPLLQSARAYNQAASRLELHLVEGYSSSLVDQLLQRHIDAAVTLSDPGDVPASIDSRPAGRESICLLTLPDDPISTQTRVDLAVIEGETLVVPSSDSRVCQLTLGRLAGRGVRPGRVLEVSGPAAVRSAVLAGQGVGVTLRSFVQAEEAAGWLRCVALGREGVDDDTFVLTARLLSHRADGGADPEPEPG